MFFLVVNSPKMGPLHYITHQGDNLIVMYVDTKINLEESKYGHTVLFLEPHTYSSYEKLLFIKHIEWLTPQN